MMMRGMVMTKKTVLARVPREIDNILRIKYPKYDSATRYRLLYDTSAHRLDNWLGQELNKNVKKKKR